MGSKPGLETVQGLGCHYFLGQAVDNVNVVIVHNVVIVQMWTSARKELPSVQFVRVVSMSLGRTRASVTRATRKRTDSVLVSVRCVERRFTQHSIIFITVVLSFIGTSVIFHGIKTFCQH